MSAQTALTPAATATGIDVIYYQVNDLNRAMAFYRDTLGLETQRLWRPEGSTEPQGAEYVLPDGSAFGVGLLPEGMAFMAKCVFFAVPNVHASVATLRDRGVEILGDVNDGPVCSMAFVNDGEGNVICLHQRKVDHD
jgi:predicted enzyme related to lactoylglutathione lyase